MDSSVESLKILAMIYAATITARMIAAEVVMLMGNAPCGVLGDA